MPPQAELHAAADVFNMVAKRHPEAERSEWLYCDGSGAQRGPESLVTLLALQDLGACSAYTHACLLCPSFEGALPGNGCAMFGHPVTPATACPAAAGAEGVGQHTQIRSSSSLAAHQPINLSARLAQLPELLAAYRATKLAAEREKSAKEASKPARERLQACFFLPPHQ